MAKNDIQNLIRESTALCAAFSDETDKFLVGLQIGVEIDFSAFEARRQKMMTEIQNIDAKIRMILRKFARSVSAETGNLMKDFAAYRKEHVRRILEMDARIIVIITEISSKIKSELKSIDQGRRALQGYGSAGPCQKLTVDRKA